MPRINSASLDSLLNAPLGPGAVIVNMPAVNPEAIEAALGGDNTKGRMLGAMTAAPSVSITHETQDLTENIVGINARLKGATQLQRSDANVTVELVEVTHDNIKLLDPTVDAVDWMSGATTPTAVGKTYRNRGFIQLTNYLDNAVMVMENLNTRVFFAVELMNCISLSDTDWEFDDEGNVSGIGLELMAHSGEGDVDPLTGAILAPYAYHLLNQPVTP